MFEKLQSVDVLSNLQVTYRYNDKNNRCLPKSTNKNIHSSYRYNDEKTDTLTYDHMSGIFTDIF